MNHSECPFDIRNLHFIFISRSDLPSVWSGCTDHMLEILGWDQTPLTVDGAGEIIRLRCKKGRPGEKSPACTVPPDGGSPGLMLMPAERVEDLEMKPARLHPPEVFDYFAAEILTGGEEVKQFLLKTPLSPRLTAGWLKNSPASPRSRILSILSGIIISRKSISTATTLQLIEYQSPVEKFLPPRPKRVFPG